MQVEESTKNISNFFVAAGYAVADNGENETISVVDFRPDSATAIGVTESQELLAMDDE